VLTSDSRLVYLCTIHYSGRLGGLYALFTESQQERADWKQKLLLCEKSYKSQTRSPQLMVVWKIATRRVLHLKMVTQCAMLEDFGMFLVLADKVSWMASLGGYQP